MTRWQLNTPVVLLIFNRPDLAERVFAEIAKARPPKLLVVADGPRADRPGDREKCEAARAVIDKVDWDCTVLKNYSDENLGCRRRVSSGLDWVFDTVEEVIILEDDCLPHPTFFRFCEELLEFYREDERIMMVSGVNFQFGRKRTPYSYYFSLYNHVWGWASWRRAWKHYDVKMELWPEIRDGGWLSDILIEGRAIKCWTKNFQSVFEERIDTWCYPWVFACWSQSGIAILPNENLVSNIGFREDATHTKTGARVANVPTKGLGFPLKHPPFVIRDALADDHTSKLFYVGTFLRRLRRRLRAVLRIT